MLSDHNSQSKRYSENFLKDEMLNVSIIIKKILTDNNLKKFETLLIEVKKALRNGKKLIFFGNGGSAAHAQHLATELTVRYKKNRKAMAAISLTTDSSAITAIGNDFGFNYIFSRQIEAIGNKGDIAIGITTSGNSKNLIETVKICKKKKINQFFLSGNSGGLIKKLTNNIILIPSNDISVIQAIQIIIGHALCAALENKIEKF
jgi:D-sedoheptulose 7-phosphate isomerase